MNNIFHKSSFIWTLFLLISVPLTVGVLWCVEKEKKEIAVIQTRILQENEEAVKKAKEAIEEKRQRADEDLVWYEIPELGVRFKVTPDSKDDLRYTVTYNKKDRNGVIVDFYSILQYQFLGEVCSIQDAKNVFEREYTGKYSTCSLWSISRYSEISRKEFKLKQGVDACFDGKVILNENNLYWCYALPQFSNFKDQGQYKSYVKWMNGKNKNLGVFIETISMLK